MYFKKCVLPLCIFIKNVIFFIDLKSLSFPVVIFRLNPVSCFSDLCKKSTSIVSEKESMRSFARLFLPTSQWTLVENDNVLLYNRLAFQYVSIFSLILSSIQYL